jgi:hypothetical protein
MEKELKCISISEDTINSGYSALNRLFKNKFTFPDKTLPSTKNLYELWKRFGLIDDQNKTYKDEIKLNCLQTWCNVLYPMKIIVKNYYTDFIMTSKSAKHKLYKDIVFLDNFCGTVYHLTQSLPKYDNFRQLTKIEIECLNTTIGILKSYNLKVLDVPESIEISNQPNFSEIWSCLGPDNLVLSKKKLSDEIRLSVLTKWLKLIDNKLDFDVTKLYEEYKSKTLSYRMKINKENYPNKQYSFENISIDTFIRDELKPIIR